MKNSSTFFLIILIGIFFILPAAAFSSPVFRGGGEYAVGGEKLAVAGQTGGSSSGPGGITLSITPPIIKNNVSPGQAWNSAVKVVNNNPQEIQVYVKVMDFKSGSESGTVEFIDDLSQDNGQNQYRLSGWIVINPGPYTIGPYKSENISFSVNIPETAAPGGHYAAILAGTNPPEQKAGGSEIKISSLLGSLLLLNVAGEAVESGRIREFSTDRKIYDRPDVNFTVRFENTGNKHFPARGVITVYDLWGKEKGNITINHYSDPVQILPESVRRWDLNWQSEERFWEMGRYKAALVLDYGDTAHSAADQTIYFWILNFKILLMIIGAALSVLFIFIFSVKAYIRRAIKTTRERMGEITPGRNKNIVITDIKRKRQGRNKQSVNKY